MKIKRKAEDGQKIAEEGKEEDNGGKMKIVERLKRRVGR